MGEQAGADFYPDPEHAGMLRFWDGNMWTDDRRPIDPVPVVEPEPLLSAAPELVASAAPVEPTADRSPRPWVVGGGIAVVVCWLVAVLGGGFGLESVAPIALIALVAIGVVWRTHYRRETKPGPLNLEATARPSSGQVAAGMFGRFVKEQRRLLKTDSSLNYGEASPIGASFHTPMIPWIRNAKRRTAGVTSEASQWRLAKLVTGIGWFALCMTFFPVRDGFAEWQWANGARDTRPLPPT